jgi:hydrogenase nickel incorporation protein HypA/HybF
MSGVVIDALQSAFEIAREETLLADTKLVIEDIPVMLHCPKCNSEQLADSIQSLCCGVCGTISPNITQGCELEVVAMEMELEPEEQLQ